MKKITLCIIFIFMAICTGCKNQGAVDIIPGPDISIDETDKNNEVIIWIDSITDSKGVFIAKIENKNNDDMYAIYIKNLKLSYYKISNVGKDGLSLETIEFDNCGISNKINTIIDRTRKAKFIIVNGNKLMISDLKVIDT